MQKNSIKKNLKLLTGLAICFCLLSSGSTKRSKAMLSIVISTKKPENLKRVLKSIEQTAILKNQLIIYENPRGRGLCVVYNECAVKAFNGLLCFVHDDMVFHTKGWDQIIVNLLQQETVGLVGVIGGRYKSLFGTSWRDGETTSYRMQVKDGVEGGKLLVNNPSNKKYDEVVCLDGAFLACTKKHWQQFPFDENRFNDFHFYDLDISLQMHTAGATGRRSQVACTFYR
ncbi:MAG: hypothetical protein EON98_11110 [Chitinophagaceae bacterium]|nr:MAG: hypothetical protein EON98_11110 [Chitinophagaceae bacterium]